jgi:hypothetical protein
MGNDGTPGLELSTVQQRMIQKHGAILGGKAIPFKSKLNRVFVDGAAAAGGGDGKKDAAVPDFVDAVHELNSSMAWNIAAMFSGGTSGRML